MAGFLDILQGGKIRANFVTAAGQTWNRGQVLVLNASSQLELLSNTNAAYAGTCGLALESCVATTTGNLMQNTNVVVAGQTGAILLGESMVINDNLSGTGAWAVGQKVHAQPSTGNLTYTAAGNASGLGLGIGTVLKTPASNGRLQFLFRAP